MYADMSINPHSRIFLKLLKCPMDMLSQILISKFKIFYNLYAKPYIKNYKVIKKIGKHKTE